MICILSKEKILMLFLLTAISLAACFSSGYSIKNKFHRHSVETNLRKRKRAILLHLLTGADVDGIL